MEGKSDYEESEDTNQSSRAFARKDDYIIEPFDLKRELEEGQFDDDGHYVGNSSSDDEAEPDAWVNSLKEDEIKTKKEGYQIDGQNTSRANTQRISRVIDVDEDEEEEDEKTKIDYYKSILRILKEDETVQKAMQRLGRELPKRNTKRIKKNDELTDCDKSNKDRESNARRDLDTLIENAQSCVDLGEYQIFQMTYDDLEEAINE